MTARAERDEVADLLRHHQRDTAMPPPRCSLLPLFLALTNGARPPPLVPKRLWLDWIALNSRSTARHMSPKTPTREGRARVWTPKSELVAACNGGEFIADAFAAAAEKSSTDADSRNNGGLLGRRMKLVAGLPELDRACFCALLGRLHGPIETSDGYHLVLVEERIGLEKYDSGMNRVVPQPLADGAPGVKSVLAPLDPEEAPEALEPGVLLNVLGFFVVTWIGGQLIAGLASSFDIEAVANSVS